MDVVAFTRQLVDIESITGNEGPVGDFLHGELLRRGLQAEKIPVEGTRCNVFAVYPEQPRPTIVFSTHMDTVPPFIPSSEDAARVYGRGSCDAKGIIAIQVEAAERLHQEGIHVGLLFVVGEERDSLGAKRANQNPPGCKFLVNGEPTENKVAIASKGALRVEVIAEGRMAHSAYPELGESAIDKLLVALTRLREMKLPSTEGIGPCTLNIGVIEGGRALNVTCRAAGQVISSWTCTPAEWRGTRPIHIPPEAVNAEGIVNLEFEMSEPKSPAELGLGQDTRELGIGIEFIRLARS